MKVNFTTFLGLIFLTSHLKATSQVVFIDGAIKQTFIVQNTSLRFAEGQIPEVSQIIDQDTAKEWKAKLLEIHWSSKKNNEKIKSKCVLYAEITIDEESRKVCRKDIENVNKMVTLLNTMNRALKASKK